MVDFLFAIIELFSLAFMVETFLSRYWLKSVHFRAFQRGRITFSANFRWKGMLPANTVGMRKLERFCYLTVKAA